MEKQQPRKIKYIGVFILCGFISSTLQKFSDLILGEALVNDLEDMNTYFILGSILYMLISISVIIFIYNIFSTLNMKKVFPYIASLGGLGSLAGIVQTSIIYQDLNIDTTVNVVSTIIAYIILVYSLRAYYVRKPERWY